MTCTVQQIKNLRKRKIQTFDVFGVFLLFKQVQSNLRKGGIAPSFYSPGGSSKLQLYV